MNKIVFVQREVEDRLGVMILSSYLKKHGVDSEIVINPHRNLRRIKNLRPDFIGISVFSPSVDWAISSCRFLKSKIPSVKMILGGPHPTFFPEIIEEEGVDMICIGEGEKPLLRLMKAYDGTLSSIINTPNFWIKNGKEIKKNNMIQLLTEEELSQLPNSDRSHYPRYSGLRHSPHRRIWTSRGCPNSCTYCFNSRYKEIYEGLGRMVRQRSVESAIEEMKQVKRMGAKVLDITDDQFLLSRKWTTEFCEKYRSEVNLPFVCNTTASRIDHETAKALKYTGCRSVNFAIESGVEEIRKNIYNKPISDEDIYKAAEALNSVGLQFLTYNMIGLPEESLEDIYWTVQINQEIKTTYPQCSILQPYPGTKITQHIVEREKEDTLKFTYSFFQSCVIGDPARQKIVSNAQKMFTYFVKNNTDYDTFVRMVNDRSIKSKFYPFMFYWHYGQGVRSRYGHSWPSLFKYWLYSKRN